MCGASSMLASPGSQRLGEKEARMLSMMRALPLLIVIGGLLGCTVDGGSARYDGSTGYRDWPHFQTLDRRD
jgi:hypothetical protein